MAMEKEMERKIKILIVDDEKEICELVKSYFIRRGYDVFTANSGMQAIGLINENNPQILLLDKIMPDMTGIELLQIVRAFDQDIKVIMISGDELDEETKLQIKELGVFDYLNKPVIISLLYAAVIKLVSLLLNE